MTCTCSKYVKINQCLQLALLVDRDVDYASKMMWVQVLHVNSTYYFPPFSFSSCLLLDR